MQENKNLGEITSLEKQVKMLQETINKLKDFTPYFKKGDKLQLKGCSTTRVAVSDSYMHRRYININLYDEVVDVYGDNDDILKSLNIEQYEKMIPPFAPKFRAGDKLTWATCPDNTCRTAVEDSCLDKHGEEYVKVKFHNGDDAVYPVRWYKKVEFMSKFKKGDKLAWAEFDDGSDRTACANSYLDSTGEEKVEVSYLDNDSKNTLSAKSMIKKEFCPQIKKGEKLIYTENGKDQKQLRIANCDSYMYNGREVVDIIFEKEITEVVPKMLVIYYKKYIEPIKPIFVPAIKKSDKLKYENSPDMRIALTDSYMKNNQEVVNTQNTVSTFSNSDIPVNWYTKWVEPVVFVPSIKKGEILTVKDKIYITLTDSYMQDEEECVDVEYKNGPIKPMANRTNIHKRQELTLFKKFEPKFKKFAKITHVDGFIRYLSSDSYLNKDFVEIVDIMDGLLVLKIPTTQFKN